MRKTNGEMSEEERYYVSEAIVKRSIKNANRLLCDHFNDIVNKRPDIELCDFLTDMMARIQGPPFNNELLVNMWKQWDDFRAELAKAN